MNRVRWKCTARTHFDRICVSEWFEWCTMKPRRVTPPLQLECEILVWTYPKWSESRLSPYTISGVSCPYYWNLASLQFFDHVASVQKNATNKIHYANFCAPLVFQLANQHKPPSAGCWLCGSLWNSKIVLQKGDSDFSRFWNGPGGATRAIRRRERKISESRLTGSLLKDP